MQETNKTWYKAVDGIHQAGDAKSNQTTSSMGKVVDGINVVKQKLAELGDKDLGRKDEIRKKKKINKKYKKNLREYNKYQVHMDSLNKQENLDVSSGNIGEENKPEKEKVIEYNFPETVLSSYVKTVKDKNRIEKYQKDIINEINKSEFSKDDWEKMTEENQLEFVIKCLESRKRKPTAFIKELEALKFNETEESKLESEVSDLSTDEFFSILDKIDVVCARLTDDDRNIYNNRLDGLYKVLDDGSIEISVPAEEVDGVIEELEEIEKEMNQTVLNYNNENNEKGDKENNNREGDMVHVGETSREKSERIYEKALEIIDGDKDLEKWYQQEVKKIIEKQDASLGIKGADLRNEMMENLNEELIGWKNRLKKYDDELQEIFQFKSDNFYQLREELLTLRENFNNVLESGDLKNYPTIYGKISAELSLVDLLIDIDEKFKEIEEKLKKISDKDIVTSYRDKLEQIFLTAKNGGEEFSREEAFKEIQKINQEIDSIIEENKNIKELNENGEIVTKEDYDIEKFLELNKKELKYNKNGEIIDGEQDLARDGTKAVLAMVDKFSELNTDNEKEGDEGLKNKAKELWTKLTVHGIIGWNKKGEPILRTNSDLDGKVAVALMKKVGAGVEKIEHVYPGEFLEGTFNLDTGKEDGLVIKVINGEVTIFIDHHGDDSRNNTSATDLAYKMLVEMGMINKDEVMDKMVKFVTQMDNKTFSDAEKYFEESDRNLIGLYRFISPNKLKEFFEDGKKPTDQLTHSELKKYGFAYEKSANQETIDAVCKQENKTLEELKKLKNYELDKYNLRKTKKGVLLYKVNRQKEQKQSIDKSLSELEIAEDESRIIDSEYGKIVVDIGKKIPAGATATLAKDYNVYLNWNLKKNYFFISSKKEFGKDFEISKGRNVRNKIWVTPTEDDVTNLKLAEVLEQFGVDINKTEGKLREYLENEGSIVVDENEKPKNDIATEKVESDMEGNLELSEKEEKIVEIYEDEIRKMLNFIKNVDYINNYGYIREEAEMLVKINIDKYWREITADMIEDKHIPEEKIELVIKELKNKF